MLIMFYCDNEIITQVSPQIDINKEEENNKQKQEKVELQNTTEVKINTLEEVNNLLIQSSQSEIITSTEINEKQVEDNQKEVKELKKLIDKLSKKFDISSIITLELQDKKITPQNILLSASIKSNNFHLIILTAPDLKKSFNLKNLYNIYLGITHIADIKLFYSKTAGVFYNFLDFNVDKYEHDIIELHDSIFSQINEDCGVYIKRKNIIMILGTSQNNIKQEEEVQNYECKYCTIGYVIKPKFTNMKASYISAKLQGQDFKMSSWYLTIASLYNIIAHKFKYFNLYIYLKCVVNKKQMQLANIIKNLQEVLQELIFEDIFNCFKNLKLSIKFIREKKTIQFIFILFSCLLIIIKYNTTDGLSMSFFILSTIISHNNIEIIKAKIKELCTTQAEEEF